MNGHGGAREGAGRKKTDRVQLWAYVKPETLEVLAAAAEKAAVTKGKVVDVVVRHMVADGWLDDVQPSVFEL